MTFRMLILICSMAVPHGDCQMKTARAFVRGPRVGSAWACGFAGQAKLGSLAAEVQPKPGLEYTKVICSQTPEGDLK